MPASCRQSPACRFATFCRAAPSLALPCVFGTLMLLGAGSVVRPLFTPVSIVVAVALFAISRTQYVIFVIWLFFLTPFVRRVVDYQLGYQETSLVVLAPILAASVSLYLLVKKLPLLYSIGFLPVLIVLCGVLYGYFVGIINNGPASATYDFLLWAAPLAFGFSIASDSRSYPAYRQAVFQRFPGGRYRARDIRRLPVLLPAALGRLLAAQRPTSPRSASRIRR